MISIRLQLEKSPMSYEIVGHSGYGYQGEDIVCAGVSSIAQTAYLGLMDIVGLQLDVKIDQKKGYLKVVLPKTMTEKQKIEADAILGTMRVGLIEFSKGFKSYVKLEEN